MATKEVLINSNTQETRVAILEDQKVAELFFERHSDRGIVGNIYKGRVVRVLPGMQAAFVDIGHERAAFLYAGDFLKNKFNDEDIDEDEEEVPERKEQHRRRRRGYEEVPPIAELVREGQDILVQVAKGPIGTKGARLTCHISLPGRNLVFMPSLKHNGVSRKIESFELRRKLKKLIDGHRSREGGFIVRTAASGSAVNEQASLHLVERQIRSDVEYLLDLWKKIQRKYQTNKAPLLLHYDLDLTTRVIRDFLDDGVTRMVVDSAYEHRKILKFIRHFNPELKKKIELYQSTTPLFDRYHIEQEISKALGKRVWLKSGGYLIIETTEALTSIDVNTGRFVGKKTLEETILRTNLEAADELCRQLRLRNIGGIIIIDFIDMEREDSKEQVYRFLENKLREDRSKTTILRISNLGLVEMTRKRARESVHRYLTEGCAACDGRGFTKSKIAIAYQVLRDIRRELPNLTEDYLYLSVHPEIYTLLMSQEKQTIVGLEKYFQKGIKMKSDPSFHLEQIAIFTDQHRIFETAPEPLPVLQHKHVEPDTEEEDDYSDEDYADDVKSIEDGKRAAAEAAQKPTAPSSEIEAPIIRSAEEAQQQERAWEKDEDVEAETDEEESPAKRPSTANE